MRTSRNLPLEFIRARGLMRAYAAWREKQIKAMKVAAGRAGAAVRWPADRTAPIPLD